MRSDYLLGMATGILLFFVLWRLGVLFFELNEQRKAKAIVPPPVTLPKVLVCAECGHTEHDHSSCSPMGCLRCPCGETPGSINRKQG